MQRAQQGQSRIFELDVDGVAAVLGIDPLRVRGVLSELIIERLVEPYAATLGRGAEDGACRITGEGLREVRKSDPAKGDRHFITVEDIDSFAAVRRVTPNEVSRLLGIHGLLPLSEQDVKTAICSVLGEPSEFKDWPGERSDVFTTRVQYQGRRVPTAFLLKGPVVRPPLYIANLGRRGDQSLRLFTEPAELFIVQYNGPIDSSVNQLLWLLADRHVSDGKPATVCVIDGADTARLLVAYNLA